MQNWNSALYDDKHTFVSAYGVSLIELLKPKQNEIILDLGCGTGHLANDICKSGARVIGIDQSTEMIEKAKNNYPDIDFLCANGHDFSLDQQFDAVFSNAALHWMTKPQDVISCIHRALKPGGRFVFEMGGKGNISHLLNAISTATQHFGLRCTEQVANYFPSLVEYANLLYSSGFEVLYAKLFPRPTPLEGEDAIRSWIKMFRMDLLECIERRRHNDFFAMVEDFARPYLYKDGQWVADYVRLRMIANKI